MGPYLGVGAAMLLGSAIMHALDAHAPVELPLLGALAAWQLTFLIVAPSAQKPTGANPRVSHSARLRHPRAEFFPTSCAAVRRSR